MVSMKEFELLYEIEDILDDTISVHNCEICGVTIEGRGDAARKIIKLLGEKGLI